MSENFKGPYDMRDRLIFSLWVFLVTFCFTMVPIDSKKLARRNSPTNSLNKQCAQKYRRLFKNQTLNIYIIFGYKDARPARFVGDGYERNMLIESLTSPCQENRLDCDFKRAKEDSNRLSKNIFGPDQQLYLVDLKVVDSSAGPDDEENRKNPFQKWKSEIAQEEFNRGLKTADIVFYNGHSRDGGGPDFEPPRLRANQHVDYPWYQKNKKGIQNMEKVLQAIKISQPKYVGLYSCVSEKIIPQIKQTKSIQWITSKKLVYYADSLQAMKNALSHFLNMQCLEGQGISKIPQQQISATTTRRRRT